MDTPQKSQPTISMSDFFKLPEVIAAQEVQKRNPYGSPLHRSASMQMREIAKRYGAERFFGKY